MLNALQSHWARFDPHVSTLLPPIGAGQLMDTINSKFISSAVLAGTSWHDAFLVAAPLTNASP
jgi:hypothetical protein